MSLTELQLAERYTGLGGSDAAPALGLSPWKSPLELYLDKRERVDTAPTDPRPFRWGNLLEPVIRQEYATVTGRTVRMPPGTVRHPTHAWMLAHVDGVTDDRRVFEAKTARSAEGWGDPGRGEVPHHYLLQVQHYMAVIGLKLADIAVLIGGSDFRIYEVEADQDLQAEIITGERDFWTQVEKGIPPPPDFELDDPTRILARLYPGTDGKTVEATDGDRRWREVYEEAKAKATDYERVAAGAKAHLLHQMGQAARLVFQDDGVQFQRKIVNRKAYAVEATTYIDARFSRIKEPT